MTRAPGASRHNPASRGISFVPMLLRITVGLVALIVVFSPGGMIEGFIGEGPIEAEIVRFTAAAILLLAMFSLVARVRRIAVPVSTRLIAAGVVSWFT